MQAWLGKRRESLSFQKSGPRFTESPGSVNKRSLWGLVSDVALGMIRMPLTSAESSSGRMAPQLLKPHQAIAVLLKIKSRCLGGGGRRGGREKSKDRGAAAPAEFFFLLCVSCILKRQARGCSWYLTHKLAHPGPRRHFSLNWWGQRMRERGRQRERKNLILLAFLSPEKTNRATQVLDRGPEPQEKIQASEKEILS